MPVKIAHSRPTRLERPRKLVVAPDNTSATDRIAAALAFSIAAGRYAAGERLPPVRKLAEDFGVNPNTIQVVLAQLQACGFVSALPRLGLVVRDIEQHGGISTWRLVFQLAQQLPARATRISADLLDMRLVLLTEALNKISEHPKRYDPSPVRRAVEKLELAVATTPDDVIEIARAELNALRILMLVVGQSVVTAVLNSIGEIYLEVPAMIQAMYVQPTDHVELWREVLARWERGALSTRNVEEIRAVLEQNDKLVIERFRKGLVGRKTAPQPTLARAAFWT
ncbi:MAG: GntR family transcriptional regulator [Nevskiales bacterium]